MLNKLKYYDLKFRKFLTKIGIPDLNQLDKSIENFHLKLYNNINIPIILGIICLMIVLSSTAGLRAFQVPEIARDGIRLVILAATLGFVGVTLHLIFNKMFGGRSG